MHAKPQKIADLQRILSKMLLAADVANGDKVTYIDKMFDYPKSHEFLEIQDRLKEIKQDLNYGRLRYPKKEK
jgi:hypothetical protein